MNSIRIPCASLGPRLRLVVLAVGLVGSTLACGRSPEPSSPPPTPSPTVSEDGADEHTLEYEAAYPEEVSADELSASDVEQQHGHDHGDGGDHDHGDGEEHDHDDHEHSR